MDMCSAKHLILRIRHARNNERKAAIYKAEIRDIHSSIKSFAMQSARKDYRDQVSKLEQNLRQEIERLIIEG